MDVLGDLGIAFDLPGDNKMWRHTAALPKALHLPPTNMETQSQGFKKITVFFKRKHMGCSLNS